jgi:hypothetical protein
MEIGGGDQTCTGRGFHREGCDLLKRACPITGNDVFLVVLAVMPVVMRFVL